MWDMSIEMKNFLAHFIKNKFEMWDMSMEVVNFL